MRGPSILPTSAWGAAIFGMVLLTALSCTGCHRSKAITAAGVVLREQGLSDLHNSVLHRLFSERNPAGLADASGAVSLQSFEAVGARLMVLSIGMPRFDMEGGEAVRIEDVLVFLRRFRAEMEAQHPEIAFVGSKSGMETAIAGGKAAVTFALEGSWLLLEGGERNPTRWVDSLAAAGVRMMGIAHRFHNDFFAPTAKMVVSGTQAPTFLQAESGLSELGAKLVAHVVSAGMLLDVSHLPEKAFWEVVAINDGRSPLIASHSNARALCDLPRNLSDRQIQAIAETGGLIGVCFHQKMLCGGENAPGVEEVADQIEYLLRVAGADHVALGSDLEGLITPATGLERLEYAPRIRTALLKRGIPSPTIEKVMWRNALRVF